jgi:hypothetical protein
MMVLGLDKKCGMRVAVKSLFFGGGELRSKTSDFLNSILQEKGWSALFLSRIAGRYNLQINLKTFIFKRKGGPICDVIYN